MFHSITSQEHLRILGRPSRTPQSCLTTCLARSSETIDLASNHLRGHHNVGTLTHPPHHPPPNLTPPTRPPLTAAQILQHPEYPHVIWDLPRREGVARVAQNRRGGPINISYELHGHGPRKILFIMGLGGLRSSWQRQSKDFGQTRGEEYTVLVLDNRGIGGSDKPYRRYSTTEMARDTVELLDHVGWTEERSVNIVGVSLGGMIAQEMVSHPPQPPSTPPHAPYHQDHVEYSPPQPHELTPPPNRPYKSPPTYQH